MIQFARIPEPFSPGEVCEILSLPYEDYEEFVVEGTLLASATCPSGFPRHVAFHSFWDILGLKLALTVSDRIHPLQDYQRLIKEFLDILAFEIDDGYRIDQATLDRSLAAWTQCIPWLLNGGANSGLERKVEALMRIAVAETIVSLAVELQKYLVYYIPWETSRSDLHGSISFD